MVNFSILIVDDMFRMVRCLVEEANKMIGSPSSTVVQWWIISNHANLQQKSKSKPPKNKTNLGVF